MLNILYDTANPPNTLIAATVMAVHPSTLDADPLGRDAINIPPRITTPDKLLLVDMRGLKRAGSTDQIR
jgi:hypothetical protein